MAVANFVGFNGQAPRPGGAGPDYKFSPPFAFKLAGGRTHVCNIQDLEIIFFTMIRKHKVVLMKTSLS